MAQKHDISIIEQPMTVATTEQGPQKRYRRLRFPSFNADVWADKNPLLQKGELGHEKDTGRFKVGDGVTYWLDLPYNSVGDSAKINGYNTIELVAGKNVLFDQQDNVFVISAKGVEYTAGDGISIKNNVISNTRTNAEWGNITGDLNNQTDLQDALGTKQDKLTAGANIKIEDNVISSTAQESFFRGRYATWTSVPTSSTEYVADFHGNTTPSYNDYIVVEDASLYMPQDFLSDPNNVMIRNLHESGARYTIEVVIQDQIRRIYYTECTGGVYAQINDWLSVTYEGGAPGVWYIKTNKEFYINNAFTPTANKLELLKTNTPYETNFYLSEKPGVAPVPIYGSWRFVYHGVWADDNILGWKPEYQIEETLPMATDTQAGIAKLYTTSGSNSDGAMTQRAVGNAISAHNTATNAHSNIRGVAGGLATLDNNAKVPMSQINDALLGNVSYQGLWNAATNTPFLADPSGDIQLPKGHYYITSVAGDRFGLHFDVGDWVISTGEGWTKVDNTDAVVAVNGRTGNVVLGANDVGAYTKEEVDALVGSWGELPDNVLVNKPNGKTNSLVITPDYDSNYGTYNVSIGTGVVDSRNHSVHIGYNSLDYTTDGGSVGIGSKSKTAGFSVAIGYTAEARAQYSIQIGGGKNKDANTLKVSNANGNFEMMSADGTIPADRIGNLDFGTMD